MKLETFALMLGLSTALAVYWDPRNPNRRGRWGKMAVSRRDAESTTDVADEAATDDGSQPDLYSLIDALLDSAKTGVTAEDLGEAASKVQEAADGIVNSKGGMVDSTDIQAEIHEAARKFNGSVAISSLFDKPLTYEASKLDAALCLLNNLAKKAKEQENAGESSTATVAAVSMTAQAIENIVMDSVGLIALHAATSEDKDVDKRWKVYGKWDRDPFGRNSYSAGISHSWRRKRRSTGHSVTKRKIKWGKVLANAALAVFSWG